MPSTAAELSVVLAALNEEESLRSLLPRLRETLARLGVAHEIVVVDGGSADGTREVAAELGARVISQAGGGYGEALREGFEAARGEWTLVLDADGQHPPEVVPALWARRRDADLVAASRWCPGGSADMPPLRRFLSRLVNMITTYGLGLPLDDSSGSFRLYRTALVKGLPPLPADFSAQQRLVAHVLARGGRAVEVPFRFSPRLAGASKARLDGRWLASYAKLLFAVPLIRRGPRPLAARWAVVALAVLLGLWGIRWGLPGPARLRAFPPRLLPTPEVARRFADSWRKLYEGIKQSHKELRSEEPVTYAVGVEEIAPGWTWPPDKLLNSYRSLLLRSENPDERKSYTILAQMRPWKLELEPLYLHYGGSFIYPLGAFLKAASVAGAVTVVSDVAHYVQHPEDMARLYLAGRVFTLLFFVGGCWLAFSLADRLAGWRAGAWAGLLAALAPGLVVNAHLLKPHPYAAYFALAAWLAALAAYDSGRRRAYVACGALAGWAAGANFGLVSLGALPLLVWAARALEGRAARFELLDGVLGAASAGAVCLLTNPYLVLSPSDFLWERTMMVPPESRFQWRALPRLARSIGPTALGWPLLALSAAGWLRAALRGGRARLLAAAALLLFAAVFSRFWYIPPAPSSARLYLPLLALAAVFAADLLAALPLALSLLLGVAAVADAGLRSYVYLENMRRDAGPASTRLRAAEWIDAHVAEGESVGLVRYPEPASVPPFRYDRVRLVIFEAGKPPADAKLPRWLVVDADDRRHIEGLLQNRYTETYAALPFQAGWARVEDDSFFADEGMFVYQRR